MARLRRDASGARDQAHLPDTQVSTPSPTVMCWLCQAASFRAEYGLLAHPVTARTRSSHTSDGCHRPRCHRTRGRYKPSGPAREWVPRIPPVLPYALGMARANGSHSTPTVIDNSSEPATTNRPISHLGAGTNGIQNPRLLDA